MLSTNARRRPRMAAELAFMILVTLLALSSLPAAGAQTKAPPLEGVSETADAPVLRDFRGVRIGMTAEEARKLLGVPADKGDTQDFYTFGEDLTAQVFYDAAGKVRAVSAIYLGGGAPTCASVLGAEATPAEDGSVYKLVRYPKAGYWVSYSRTAGDAPLVTVVINYARLKIVRFQADRNHPNELAACCRSILYALLRQQAACHIPLFVGYAGRQRGHSRLT